MSSFLMNKSLKQKTDVLLSNRNMWISQQDLFKTKRLELNEEEAYYMAMILLELETEQLQRSLIDILHVECSEDTVKKVFEYFPMQLISKIMYSC